MAFSFRLNQPPSDKLAGASAAPVEGRVKVIVKVKTPGHVPKRTTVRSRLDPQMFTAELDASDLGLIAADPDVVAISPAQRVERAGR